MNIFIDFIIENSTDHSEIEIFVNDNPALTFVVDSDMSKQVEFTVTDYKTDNKIEINYKASNSFYNNMYIKSLSIDKQRCDKNKILYSPMDDFYSYLSSLRDITSKKQLKNAVSLHNCRFPWSGSILYNFLYFDKKTNRRHLLNCDSYMTSLMMRPDVFYYESV